MSVGEAGKVILISMPEEEKIGKGKFGNTVRQHREAGMQVGSHVPVYRSEFGKLWYVHTKKIVLFRRIFNRPPIHGVQEV